MKKFGKVILVLIAVIAAVQIVVIAAVFFSKRIRPNTVLTLRLEGDIREQPPDDALAQIFFGSRTTIAEIVTGLERARRDPRISGLELRVNESTLGLAKMQEIRHQIREFNRAGKFSVAYLEFATNRTYYVASASGNVFLLPKSLLYVRGPMASTTFLRGTLDKLGIYPDLYHVGDYKNAREVYTEKKYTAAHREATQALLDDWYGQFLHGVAESRGLKAEAVEAALRKGPFNSEEALRERLVDRVAYSDEFREFVKQKNKGSENRLSFAEYLRRTDRQGRSKLAVIFATGTIVPGRSSDSPLGEDFLGAETVAEQFRRAREDESVKAVILRVDSPGGVAFASEVIFRELVLTKKEKPVVVSMSDVAASGGYWIAMAANKIVAEPGTITGSIGVVTGKLNLMGLYEKLGLSKDFIATTENSTLDWPFQNFTPSQRKTVVRLMGDIYGQFLRGVAEGRRMDVKAVDRIAQGRVWTGERARKLGLVDELGGLDTAITLAKDLAKIPQTEEVSLIYLPPPKPLFARLRNLLGGVKVDGGLASPRQWLESLEPLARIPAWTILPAVPEVQ